jgi:hypothetical protein
VLSLVRAVLPGIMSDILKDIRDATDTTTATASAAVVEGGANAGAGGNGSAFKKAEELLISRLHMMEMAVRGAAEVLGDLTVEPEDLTAPLSQPPWRLLTTGRESLIASLPAPEDRVLLQTLRIEVLRFLTFLQEAMYTSIPSTHPYAALKNNITLQTSWMNLFSLVVMRRMACLKDVDNVRKYLRYSVKSARSSVSNVVYHRLKAHTYCNSTEASSVAKTPWQTRLATVEYWKFHDSSTSVIACMAWAAHISRCRALSNEAVRRCDAPSFVRCLEILLQRLCNHEYDEIRKVALKQFDAVSSRFGNKMLSTVQGVVTSLSAARGGGADKLSYWGISGALSVLAQSRVQKRILGEPALLQVRVICWACLCCIHQACLRPQCASSSGCVPPFTLAMPLWSVPHVE